MAVSDLSHGESDRREGRVGERVRRSKVVRVCRVVLSLQGEVWLEITRAEETRYLRPDIAASDSSRRENEMISWPEPSDDGRLRRSEKHRIAQFVPGTCANCDGTGVTQSRPLYCSEFCQQAAKLVRYVRARRRDGTAGRPDIKEAIQMRTASVLGGGYPERERRVRADVRARVFERAEGRCEECGRVLEFGVGTGGPDALATIQHVNGNSNSPEDLKAFCRRCNLADAQSRFVPVEPGSPPELLAISLEIRCAAEPPLRRCDDDLNWGREWRAMATEAKEVLKAQEELEEGASDEDLPGFLGWTEQGTPIQDC